MTLTHENKQKLLDFADFIHGTNSMMGFSYLRDIIGLKNAQEIYKANLKSPKALARVIRRFVRTGVLEFKKSEVRDDR